MQRTSLLACVLVLAGCAPSRAPEPRTSPPRPVEVAVVSLGAPGSPVVGTAILGRLTEARLGFRAAGFLAGSPFRPGDRFSAGDVLAVLDAEDLDANFVRAQSLLAKARRDLARAQRLTVGDALAVERLDDARTGVEQAEAAARAAGFELDRTWVVAAFSGTVLERLAEPGELVTPGRPVLRVAEDGAWVVRVGVSDRDAARLRVGAAAAATFGRLEIPGRVVEIAGGVAGPSRSVEVVVELVEEPAGARVGNIGSVRIEPIPGDPLPEVPASALVAGDGDAASVFVVREDGTVRRVVVGVQRLTGGRAVVSGPVAAGELVVTAGAPYLRHGERVRVVCEER